MNRFPRLVIHTFTRTAFGILAAAVCGLAFCSGAESAAPLPDGVTAVWDTGKAHRDTTPTRERIFLNRFLGSQPVFAHPDWKTREMGGINAAWYQREFTVPREWAGRRIAVGIECLNSSAAAFVDGNKAGEIHFPAGDLDLTAACKPGATHVLS